MIIVEHLSKSYHRKTVVQDLSFAVPEGNVFALLGSNGAGKSTTIKMILGLVKKEAGTVTVPTHTTIGYSPETPYFPPFLTAKEVLVYYAKLQKLPHKTIHEEAQKLLACVGLENSHTKIRHYSKGMLQRLALAQALLGNPQILILDEPCAGLDAMGRVEMLELIRRLKEDGKTILMNSHILSDMERVCDEGIILKDGEIMRTFTKEELKEPGTLEKLFLDVAEKGVWIKWEPS